MIFKLNELYSHNWLYFSPFAAATAGRKLSGGEAANVLLLPVGFMPGFDAVMVVVVFVVLVVALVDVRAARPFALAFRSLL